MEDVINKDSPFYAAHIRAGKKFIAIGVVLLAIYMCPIHFFVEPYFQSKYGSLLLFPMLFGACILIAFSYYVALKLTPLTESEKEKLKADFEKFVAERKKMKAMSDSELLSSYDFVKNNDKAAVHAELERRGLKPI